MSKTKTQQGMMPEEFRPLWNAYKALDVPRALRVAGVLDNKLEPELIVAIDADKVSGSPAEKLARAADAVLSKEKTDGTGR